MHQQEGSMTIKDPKQRFSDRVADYRKYRPSYPSEAIQFVKEHCAVDSISNIADIGSGTGISTQSLLDVFQCHVYAIEPNDNMRMEAERALEDNPFFHSIKGSSEETTLKSGSIDLIAAFQAFHWFDRVKSRKEFDRISRSPKWVLLVWNDRKTQGSEFLEEYEAILKKLPEYHRVTHKNTTVRDIQDFIGARDLLTAEFPHAQRFNFEGLTGRFFSSSYTPAQGTDEYQEVIGRLETLFNLRSVDGMVTFEYTTQVYLGTMR
jgi:SAM-dependent methyltransferase